MTSDEALYEQLLDGDMTAFDALYRRYERPLFGFIRRYVPSTEQAEEVFHEAFLTVLRHSNKARTVRSFKSWIYRVARNQCLNQLRHQKRAAKAMANVAQAADRAKMDNTPTTSVAQAQTSAALERAVARLPKPLFDVYALRASGLSYGAVADALNLPLGTVKSRMNKMLKTLREELST